MLENFRANDLKFSLSSSVEQKKSDSIVTLEKNIAKFFLARGFQIQR